MRLRRWFTHNSKINFKEVEYDVVDFYLVHDRDSWWTFVNTVKVIRVSYKARHF